MSCRLPFSGPVVRWAPVKVAAQDMRENGFPVSDRTLFRWCKDGWVLADRVGNDDGGGPWVVGVNDQGYVVRTKQHGVAVARGSEPTAT